MVLLAVDSGTIISLVLLLAIMALFLRWSKRNIQASAERAKKFSQRTPSERPLAHNLDAPSDMARAEIQMHDLARDLFGQLDSKIAIVTRLLQMAEEQAARLERALERAERLGGPPADPAAGVTPHPPAATEPRDREIFSLADQGYSSAMIASRVDAPIGEVELILSLRGNAPR
jgi:hypothetical protein